MMKEFCIEIEVGELNPFSSPEAPTLVVVPRAVYPRFVGDFPRAEAPGEPAPIVPLF